MDVREGEQMSDWLKIHDDRIDAHHRLIVQSDGKQYIWSIHLLDEGGEKTGSIGSGELYKTVGKAIAAAHTYYHERIRGGNE